MHGVSVYTPGLSDRVL